MNSYHGRVINYKDMNKFLPKRRDFLENDIYNKTDKDLKRGKNILFHPTALWDGKPMQDYQYDKSKYKIVLFGILEDGRRASVLINGITPYFEIKIPDDKLNNKESFAEEIFYELNMGYRDRERFLNFVTPKNNLNDYWKIEPLRYKIVDGKPFKYFQESNSYYVQIYFHKLTHRRDAIKYAISKGYTTAHDDISCYYRVVCRDMLISFSSWIELHNFIIETDNNYIKGDVIRVSIQDIKIADNIDDELRKDKTMTMCWDIETFNHNNDGKLPEPNKKSGNREIPNWEHVMFMIGITFQWFNSNEQLLRICLVDVEAAPHPDFLTIVCGNEQNLIKAFSKCYENMKPEIVMGFNDSSYDWNWIIKRAKAYRGLLSYIGEKFDMCKREKTDADVESNFKKIKVKIEADVNATGQNLQFPGYIPVDVMIAFRQLYPTSEVWSLSFFLSKNKLGGKEDMPYNLMFQIYKSALDNPNKNTAEQMKEVANYCVIDAQRCHELMKIRNVLQDKREVANLSYTSIYDAFYYANGMKVRNLVIARGQLRNLKLSNVQNKDDERGQYPGAWVFPPLKGLVTSKLSISERIAKAKMGYEEYAEWLEKTEHEIKEELDFINRNGAIMNDDHGDVGSPALEKMLREETGRPITGLDFSSLYPSLIMTYNLSPEYIIIDKQYAIKVNSMVDDNGQKKHTLYRIEFPFNGGTIKGWSIRHDNKLDPNSADYKFGIFPAILKELFDARTKLKKDAHGLNFWEHKREELLLIAKDNPERWESKEIQDEYEDVCFNYNTLDSKQRALKVFMNTFYGEVGNKCSSLFMLQVAGGITTAGQKNIKKAYNFVQERGCKVYYGDSVTADTPILIKYPDGDIVIKTIDNIPGSKWSEYPQFKPHESDPIRIDKQQHLPLHGLKVWSSNGWTLIRRIIRHRTNKRILRINTRKGCVDVTEDHSLINSNRKIIRPTEAKIGDALFHSYPINLNKLGYCDIHDSKIRVKNKLYAAKYYYKYTQQGFLCDVYYDVSDDVYILTKEYAYDIKRNKCATCMREYPYCHKDSITKQSRSLTDEIIQIIELPEVTKDVYVYDIETEDGTFLAGIGSICVKNTDSLYISMPDKEFNSLDLDYYTERISKLQYWEEMVRITFDMIKVLNKEVNEMFVSDNGTNFLKMSYEEILFPVLFTAKKKYVGVPHVSAPNFDSTVPLFIRGLELKKRGVSEMLKNVCNDILRKCMDHDNILTVIEIVQNKIREIYTTDWTDNFKDFIMTGVYKPHKKNIKMHTFRDRMKEERSIELKPGERIEYVIVQKYPYKYDLRGRKIHLKIGDKMELTEIAKKENMKIDLDYYMENSINGQLARFITYYKDFHVEPKSYTNKDEVKKAEEKILKKAKDYVDSICEEFFIKYEDHGAKHKENYKKSSEIVSKKMIEICDEPNIIKLLGFSVKIDDDIGSWLVDKIHSVVEKKKANAEYAKKYIDDRLNNLPKEARCKTLIELQSLYYADKKNNLLKSYEASYNERHNVLMMRIQKSLTDIKSIFHTNNEIIEILVELLQCDPSAEESLLEEIAESAIIEKLDDIKKYISEVKFIYYNMIGNYECIYKIRKIVDYLKELRDEKAHVIKPPANINDMISQMARETAKEFLEDEHYKTY